MDYRVEMSIRAQRDYADLFATIHAEDSPAAAKWHRGLKRTILSLENMPARCTATREYARLKQVLYGRRSNVYRVIFRIFEKEKQVHILHIRHGARDHFKGA
jgi:toxin ParE1/3/4